MKTILLILILTVVPGTPDVLVELHTYAKNNNIWIEELAGTCTTDAAGTCAMEIKVTPWQDGLIRGYLAVGEYGQRPLIGPGGEMEMKIELGQAAAVDQRYDHLPEDGTAAPQIVKKDQRHLWGWLAVVTVILVWVGAGMIQKKKAAYLLIFLCIWLLMAPVAHAAPLEENYCFPTFTPDRCMSLMQVMENWGARMFSGLTIGLMKGIAQVIWLFDRAAAYIFFRSAVDVIWLTNIKQQMLTVFSGMMPAFLQDIAFGSGGLMYIALGLSGLVMMVPMWGSGQRFVKPERVIGWGILLSFLFITGSFGIDFLGQIEVYRHGLVNNIMQGSGMPLDVMIQQPMLAGSGDLGFGDDLLALPPVFDSTYFPEPQLLEITISEGGGFGFGNAVFEPVYEIARRVLLAGQGVFYAFVSGFSGWLLLLAGLTYVVLSFVALLIIVFIFAALPLGFFEMGEVLLWDLAGRYFQVIVQSLTLAIFLRWLSSSLGYIVNVNTVTNSLTWIVVVVVMIIVTGSFLKGALKLLAQSGQSFMNTLSPNTSSHTLSSGISKIAGGVAAVSMLAGRPDVAVAANAVGSAASSSATMRPPQPSIIYAQSPEYTQRGNVFDNNGMGSPSPAPTTQPASVTMPAPQPSVQQQPPSPSSVAAPVVPPAAMQTISSRAGWDDVQVKQVEEAAKSSKTVDEAILQLQRAPGFERTDSNELRQAVEAARNIK